MDQFAVDDCLRRFCHARHSAFLLGTEQAGKAGDRQRIAVDTEAADHRFCRLRNVGILPESFARMNIGNVHFDRPAISLHGQQRIHNGDRCRGVAGRVDDDARPPSWRAPPESSRPARPPGSIAGTQCRGRTVWRSQRKAFPRRRAWRGRIFPARACRAGSYWVR